jgi:hypothetical protein
LSSKSPSPTVVVGPVGTLVLDEGPKCQTKEGGVNGRR